MKMQTNGCAHPHIDVGAKTPDCSKYERLSSIGICQRGLDKGKSKAAGLRTARKGVTKEQAPCVKQLYEQQNNVNASNATGTMSTNPAFVKR